jgi:UDP-N-acetylmuramoyl-L-alanyl-D-glutamate--2,6-diaminopimelate ligase
VPEPDGATDHTLLFSQLAEHFERAQLIGDALIHGVSSDSRTVQRGDLFLAFPGEHHDGHRFAREALRRGAVALVVERVLDIDLPQLVVNSVMEVAGPLASAFYGYPSDVLEIVGVTGTNGKTTTSQLLRACLGTAQQVAAQIGTTGVYFGDDLVVESQLSTPQAPDLQRLFSQLKDRGARRISMEVTSHGLHAHRVDGTHFRVGIFLNLTPEHLDYHGTMEEYFDAKSRMFEVGRCDEAIICVDDEWGRRLASRCQVPVTTFGHGADADVRVEVDALGLAGLRVRVIGPDFSVEIRSALIGRVNSTNIAAAFLAARSLGINADYARRALSECAPPPGRFEILTDDQPFLAVADYAHTPDALRELIATAREVAPGRVLLVFGARGQRYVEKRPQMARCAAGADHVWITTDSPGDEDPAQIIEALLSGIEASARGRVSVEPDRAAAIRAAVNNLGDGDILLMTGRGPESTQRFGERHVVLDDRVVARLELDARRDFGEMLPFGNSVAVVVPTWNVGTTLAAAISSVLDQSSPVDEIVVVDDGSDDDTLDVARSFGDRVRLERHTSLGRHALLNYGAAHSSSTWITFLDPADEWHPRKIELQLAALRKGGAAVCAADCSSEADVVIAVTPPRREFGAGEVDSMELIEMSSVMIRRDVFGLTGGFATEEPAGPDGELLGRAAKFATLLNVDAPLVIHRRGVEAFTRRRQRSV